jgi:hypothetical protein
MSPAATTQSQLILVTSERDSTRTWPVDLGICSACEAISGDNAVGIGSRSWCKPVDAVRTLWFPSCQSHWRTDGLATIHDRA